MDSVHHEGSLHSWIGAAHTSFSLNAPCWNAWTRYELSPSSLTPLTQRRKDECSVSRPEAVQKVLCVLCNM
jgi:hypothetical protein